MLYCNSGKEPSYLPLLEPEKTQHTSNTEVLLEDVGDGDPGIEQFLSSLITDAGHEWCWLPDQSQLLKEKVANTTLKLHHSKQW